MKRTIPLLLGLILLLSAAAFAGEPAATRIFPTWGKIDAETIQSIIEQLPPGVEYILIHAGSEEEDGGVNRYFIPWEDLLEEVSNDSIHGMRSNGGRPPTILVWPKGRSIGEVKFILMKN